MDRDEVLRFGRGVMKGGDRKSENDDIVGGCKRV